MTPEELQIKFHATLCEYEVSSSLIAGFLPKPLHNLAAKYYSKKTIRKMHRWAKHINYKAKK